MEKNRGRDDGFREIAVFAVLESARVKKEKKKEKEKKLKKFKSSGSIKAKIKKENEGVSFYLFRFKNEVNDLLVEICNKPFHF